MAQVLTTITFALHILGGAVAMVAGLISVCARKGGYLHRTAGDMFVIAMTIMTIFAAILGVIRPGQIINVFIAAFTLYLVTTGWLTARRANATTGAPEFISLAVSLVLCAPFALLIFQITTGVVLFKSAFTIKGPILIALCVFSAIMATAAIGDLRLVVNRGLSGIPRIARHLWRMCFGLALALGSAFTNGFARMLPGAYHVPPAFFLPQLLMLVILLYWLVRIRFPGWAGKASAKSGRHQPARSRSTFPL
jgi:hypothetical protein